MLGTNLIVSNQDEGQMLSTCGGANIATGAIPTGSDNDEPKAFPGNSVIVCITGISTAEHGSNCQ